MDRYMPYNLRKVPRKVNSIRQQYRTFQGKLRARKIMPLEETSKPEMSPKFPGTPGQKVYYETKYIEVIDLTEDGDESYFKNVNIHLESAKPEIQENNVNFNDNVEAGHVESEEQVNPTRNLDFLPGFSKVASSFTDFHSQEHFSGNVDRDDVLSVDDAEQPQISLLDDELCENDNADITSAVTTSSELLPLQTEEVESSVDLPSDDPNQIPDPIPDPIPCIVAEVANDENLIDSVNVPAETIYRNRSPSITPCSSSEGLSLHRTVGFIHTSDSESAIKIKKDSSTGLSAGCTSTFSLPGAGSISTTSLAANFKNVTFVEYRHSGDDSDDCDVN